MTQAEQLAAQAAQWQAAGRADMAVQLYGAALEQDPSKFAIRMQLAECLVALGQPEPAAEQYLMVAQAYAARSRQQECLAICERVIAIAPHAFVYMTVGPMVRRIGRLARPICAHAAEVHLAAGRQTDGLQMLRLGAELDPHNPEVRRQLARIYQSRHMKREAVEALSDAGNLLLQAKRYDDYVEVAEQILALEPRELDTLRDLPRVYLELRRPHEAVRTLAELTKASPGDIVGYEILAQAFAMIGRVDKSLSVLERLVEELGATGQADKADAILNHARYWRPTDVGFLRSIKRMEIPRAAAPVERPAARPAAPEGTVVLSIADLLVDEGSKRAPAPGSRAVQLTEAEGTLTLRLDDLILDDLQQAAGKGVAPTRPPLGAPPPPPGRRATLPPPPGRPGAAASKASEGAGPRREAPPLPKPGALGKGHAAPRRPEPPASAATPEASRGPRRTLEAPPPIPASGVPAAKGPRRTLDATVGPGAAEAGRSPRRIVEALVEPTLALDSSRIRLDEPAESTVAFDSGKWQRERIGGRVDATMALAAGSGPPRSAEASVDATMALDAGDLMEALTGELSSSDLPRPPAQAPAGGFPSRAQGRFDEDRTTVPPPGRSAGRSMSDLIYDDEEGEPDGEHRRDEPRRFEARRGDDDEPEPETLLHMRALTAADIARALAKQAAQAAPAAVPEPPEPPELEPFDESDTVPPPSRHAVGMGDDSLTKLVPEPLDESDTVPPPSRHSLGMGDDAPTMFVPEPFDDVDTAPPPSRHSVGMGDEAPTMFAGAGLLDELATVPPASRPTGDASDDAPTMFPGSAWLAAGMPDEAPTMPPASRPPDEAPTVPPASRPPDEALTVAKLSPLTAADIARALSQRSPSKPVPAAVEPTPEPEPAPAWDEPPPLLPPLPPRPLTSASDALDDDEEEDEEMLTTTMDALRPEDLLRGIIGGRGGTDRTGG